MSFFHRAGLILAVVVTNTSWADGALLQGSPLEEVVVTASRSAQRVFDSPASLSVINEEELARSTSYALADLLRDIPGMQVTDSGQPGLKRVRIRGEESRRTAILVNGQEVTDHHEVGTPLTLHPAMVERIEVIRGSGSVLYGSRALSGVVNFMTRKGGSKPAQVTLAAGYDGATSGQHGFASVFGNVEGFDYRLAYSTSEHRERSTPQGEIENTAFENTHVYAYAGKSIDAQRLEYTFEDYTSSADVFVEEAVRSSFPLTDFYLQTPQRDRRKHGLYYHWEADTDWLHSVQANAHYQVSERQFYTRTETVWYERDIHNDGQLDTSGALLQLNLQPMGKHQILLGVQYLDDEVEQRRRVDTVSWTPTTPTGVATINDQASIETWAWFVQDRVALADSLSVTAGVRQYAVSGALQQSNRASLSAGQLQDDKALIGALGLVWDYSDSARIRLGIAQGYVYPSLMQLATGAYAGSRFVNPSMNLTPETSVNYEAGLRLQNTGLVADLTLFYTQSKDYIHHLPCTPADGCPGSRDRLYQNVGESDAHGAEFYLSLPSTTWQLTPYVNLTWMQRRNRYQALSTWDSGIPDYSGRVGARWQGTWLAGTASWADFYVRGETASALEEPGTTRTVLEDKDRWLTLNMAGGVSFGAQQRYKLAAELHNLTDQSYITATENLYGAERSIAVKFTMDW